MLVTPPAQAPPLNAPWRKGRGYGRGMGMDRETGREKGGGKGWNRSFRQPGQAPHTLCLPLQNVSLPAGLLVATRGCPTKAWRRPAPQGTRLFGQSCHRPAGQRASQEPGSGGLPEGVEYIPTRKKGKNPMKPVGVAW